MDKVLELKVFDVDMLDVLELEVLSPLDALSSLEDYFKVIILNKSL